MSHPALFKWKHFQHDIILLKVRWYCRYSLSYRDLEEMMAEQGLSVDHNTINRWVLQYVPEVDQRCRPHLRPTNDSWKVDETYVKVKGEMELSLSSGQTLDFMLSAKRDAKAAKRVSQESIEGPSHIHTAYHQRGQECGLRMTSRLRSNCLQRPNSNWSSISTIRLSKTIAASNDGSNSFCDRTR